MSTGRVAFGISENRGILAYLSDDRDGSVSVARQLPECAPVDVDDPYLTLGTHPDMVTKLWDEMPARLPQDCRWIVYGTPTLVRPDSGIIFAFAGGTHTYALRLEPGQARAARDAGAKTIHDYPAYPDLGLPASRLDLATIGSEWVFGGWLANEEQWCLDAYEYAHPVTGHRR